MLWLYSIPILLIFYGIALFQLKRSYGVWLMPWTWINGIFKSFFGVVSSQKSAGSKGDNKWQKINSSKAEEVLDLARLAMINRGIIYVPKAEQTDINPGAYIPRSFDCENFGTAMKDEFDFAWSKKYGISGLGIPSIVMGYDRDKGGGHAVLQIKIDNTLTWWQVYPQAKYFKQMQLSLNEIRTLTPVTTG